MARERAPSSILEWCSRAASVADQAATAGRLTVAVSLTVAEHSQAHIARLHGPLVVLFEQDGGDQPHDSCLIGRDADYLGALLISPFSRSSGLVLSILARCSFGNVVKASISTSASSIRSVESRHP